MVYNGFWTLVRSSPFYRCNLAMWTEMLSNRMTTRQLPGFLVSHRLGVLPMPSLHIANLAPTLRHRFSSFGHFALYIFYLSVISTSVFRDVSCFYRIFDVSRTNFRVRCQIHSDVCSHPSFLFLPFIRRIFTQT